MAHIPIVGAVKPVLHGNVRAVETAECVLSQILKHIASWWKQINEWREVHGLNYR